VKFIVTNRATKILLHEPNLAQICSTRKLEIILASLKQPFNILLVNHAFHTGSDNAP